jgi:hypothetical protein
MIIISLFHYSTPSDTKERDYLPACFKYKSFDTWTSFFDPTHYYPDLMRWCFKFYSETAIEANTLRVLLCETNNRRIKNGSTTTSMQMNFANPKRSRPRGLYWVVWIAGKEIIRKLMKRAFITVWKSWARLLL